MSELSDDACVLVALDKLKIGVDKPQKGGDQGSMCVINDADGTAIFVAFTYDEALAKQKELDAKGLGENVA